MEVEGRRLRLSNLDKVLYPDTGTTKGEVIDYVTRIAPLLLPHLAGRPVTRLRWPEGVGHPPFFAKDLEPGAPDWIPRRAIDHSTGAKDYPLVEDLPTLVYLAQVASLELHTPQWRFDAHGARRHPDRLVLDLDPGPGVGLVECAVVARLLRTILDDLGMPSYPVTSGSKGIHLYARLDGTRTSEEISAFAKELARLLEADHPDLVVSQMTKTLRAGKVLLDWSQNNAAKTTIAPYSLRGRAEPMVAAPRTWAELDEPDLRQLRFDEVLARAEASGDPLAELAPAPPSPLTIYLAKRSAERTPEPMPTTAPTTTDGSRFVIQEHHASRRHFDLRLERDGVLVSWAVPRGIPDSADRNHLAVMTEPHPREYLTFEGEIPRGEYGAGTMSIWDTGDYVAEKWRDDEVIFTASGREGGPLGTACLALIRTAGSGEKSQWLLHRMTARPPSIADAGAEPDDATPSPVRVRARPAAPPARASTAPMLATPATEVDATRAARRWDPVPWVEFKWDGIRAIGTWDGVGWNVRARSGTDITARYPEIVGTDPGFGPEPITVDGEIVAFDPRGVPSFSRLQNRMHLTKGREIDRESARTPVTFLLFDVLSSGGTDATALPLAERRKILEARADGVGSAIVVPPVADDVAAALAAARELGLEGVVVKDPGSAYRGGSRSESWLKVKITHTQDVVIGGIRPGRGGRAGGIGSLLLGIPGPDGLAYVGRVGSGFSERERERLDGMLVRTGTNPFLEVPSADASDAVWVEPRLVGEVEFAEFTPNDTLRHARWRGLRMDVDPAEVRRETRVRSVGGDRSEGAAVVGEHGDFVTVEDELQ